MADSSLVKGRPSGLGLALSRLREGTEILRTGGGTTLTAEQCNGLLDHITALGDEIERRAAENARLHDGVSRLVAAIYAVYEQTQSVARKPSLDG